MEEKNLEDYSIEELEVKKRICEEKINEIKNYSIMHRLSKRIRYDIYQILIYLFFIELLILVIVMVYVMAPIFLNPTQVSTSKGTEIIPIFFIIFPLMITGMLMGTDHTSPYQKRLKEINRAIRIIKEVYAKDSERSSDTQIVTNEKDLKIKDECDILEYKASFRYDYKTGKSNKNLQIEVIKGSQSLLNNRGGLLRIGVTDKKEFIGVANDLQLYNNDWDKYQLDITNNIVEHLGGSVSDLVQIIKIEENKIIGCNIIITASPKEVWFKEGNKEHFYVRINNRKKELTGRELVDYINSHWLQQKIEKAGLEPVLNVDIHDGPFVPAGSTIEIIIENVGHGVAKNVSFFYKWLYKEIQPTSDLKLLDDNEFGETISMTDITNLSTNGKYKKTIDRSTQTKIYGIRVTATCEDQFGKREERYSDTKTIFLRDNTVILS